MRGLDLDRLLILPENLVSVVFVSRGCTMGASQESHLHIWGGRQGAARAVGR